MSKPQHDHHNFNAAFAQKKTIGLYSKVKPSEAIHGPEEVAMDNVTEGADFSKPTLICLGGVYAQSSKDARSVARFAQRILGRIGVYDHDLQITAAAYPYPENELMDIVNAYGKEEPLPEQVDDIALSFVARQFLPLIASHASVDDQGEVHGEKRSIENVKRKFANIRFMTHSYGGVVCEQIDNALVHCMQSIGYTEQEIKDTTKEIMVLNAGSVGDPRRNKAHFTQISLFNYNDDIIHDVSPIASAMNATHPSLQDHLESHGRYDADRKMAPLNIFPLEGHPNHTIVFFDEMGGPEEFSDGYFNVNVKGAFADKHGELWPREKDYWQHELRTYMQPKLGKHGLVIPLLAQNVLINALNNSFENTTSDEFIPLPGPMALMKVPSKPLFLQAPAKSIGVYGKPKTLAWASRYQERVDDATLPNQPTVRS